MDLIEKDNLVDYIKEFAANLEPERIKEWKFPEYLMPW